MVVCRTKRPATMALAGVMPPYPAGGRLLDWRSLGDQCSATVATLVHAYTWCSAYSDRWQPYAHVFSEQRHQMVDKAEGQTNPVERWFNTLRQRLARFTRKTLAFSKRQDLHDGLVHMFICDYNRGVIS